MNTSNESCVRADKNATPNVRSGSILLKYTKSLTLSTVVANLLPSEIFLTKLYILTSSDSSREPLFSKLSGKAGDRLLGKNGIGAQNETLKTIEFTTSGFTWTRR